MANDDWASMTRLAILLVELSWIKRTLTQSGRGTKIVAVNDVHL